MQVQAKLSGFEAFHAKIRGRTSTRMLSSVARLGLAMDDKGLAVDWSNT